MTAGDVSRGTERELPPSDGQLRALRVLADGVWHRSTREGAHGTIIGSIGAALVRARLAERRGASRTADPRNPGYEYRITAAGRAALGKTADDTQATEGADGVT